MHGSIIALFYYLYKSTQSLSTPIAYSKYTVPFAFWYIKNNFSFLKKGHNGPHQGNFNTIKF